MRAARVLCASAVLGAAGCGAAAGTPDADVARDAVAESSDAPDPSDAGTDALELIVDGLTLAPTPWSFGELGTGMTSVPATFTVTNSGDGPSGIITAAIRGLDADGFRIVDGSDQCSGAPLASGATCTIDVVFAPTWLGAHMGLLEVTSSEGAVHATLSGTGIESEPPLVLTPTSADFGARSAACPGEPIEIVLTNVGMAPSGILEVRIDGPDAAAFSIDGSPCALGLDPGEPCPISVRFVPTRLGPHTANLKVSSATATLDAPLTGIGLADCPGG